MALTSVIRAPKVSPNGGSTEISHFPATRTETESSLRKKKVFEIKEQGDG
jgi:hypothetical protein